MVSLLAAATTRAGDTIAPHAAQYRLSLHPNGAADVVALFVDHRLDADEVDEVALHRRRLAVDPDLVLFGEALDVDRRDRTVEALRQRAGQHRDGEGMP